jgi:hypothetical protein
MVTAYMSMTILVGIYFTFFLYIRPEYPPLPFFFLGLRANRYSKPAAFSAAGSCAC